MEGVVKGGHHVDISSPADLTSVVHPDSLLESGLETAAGAQFKDGYSYSRETDVPPSISEVIQPMEIAELVDILPTLSLIEEEYATGPSSPSVMDMLENFGLGIGETDVSFDFRGSNLTSGVETLLQTPCENVLRGQDAASFCNSVHSVDDETPALRCTADKLETKSQPCLPVRSLVEWDKPSSSSF